MSIARRTLLTTTAAGTLLCALWFVPSADATDGTTIRSASTGSSEQVRQPLAAGESGAREADGEAGRDVLADTGTGIDTTPYVVGGTLSLCVGAGFVAYSVRRAGSPSAAA
ncbi:MULTISPECIES: hypothetical protein [Streptomyces]|uniref:LPXTG cell wall anchor domain-containing protein n=1 Tax=Streptomyces halstedii TaxID=1944 RepID=A0A6N9TRS9_STRHA|nr:MULTISPECIES: hypothetical protein [unclassified Streptomyces]AWL40290.1 hypothetical protein B9S64_21045 [Streptomyces sp. SM18]NEA14161.1 hypothetical protein [Streptomyces halstedii]